MPEMSKPHKELRDRRSAKRDRMSHSSAKLMKNFGKAKKGGGGGKGTWGKVGDEMYIPEMDPGDPCYEHDQVSKISTHSVRCHTIIFPI